MLFDTWKHFVSARDAATPSLRTWFGVLAAVLALTLASAAPARALTYTCVDDLQGADDEPGQKDLNRLCSAGDTASPYELNVTWNFDDIRWNGSNTGDGCGLFDTDGDGDANFALCVTLIGGPPAIIEGGSPRLYTCNDSRPDRCGGSVAIASFNSKCTVNVPSQDNDPFIGPTHTQNKCTGNGCQLKDSFVKCDIDVNDVLASAPTCGANRRCSNDPTEICATNGDCVPLTDVCSYPSMQPNSDPSDCVITNPACAKVDCSGMDDSCNVGECDPVTAQCVKTPKDDGTECGGTATECRGVDVCEAGRCVASYEPEGTACGDYGDSVCDKPDTCDGYGDCQANHEGSSVTCRSADGECDKPEYCDGYGSCPADAFKNKGTACGDYGDTVCDNPDTCDGYGDCDANHEPDTKVCRGAYGVCDVAEYCYGGVCPEDGHADAGTPCDDGDACTTDDECTDEGMCEGAEGACNAVCRTPGFWGNRGRTPLGRRGVTDKVLMLAGGSIEVCGQTIDQTTPIGSLESVLEAECVSVEGVSQRQLYRQLVATRLNCILSYADNCDDVMSDFSACDALCAGGDAPEGLDEGTCIQRLDCFNNGGTLADGKCAYGTCAQSGEKCGADYGSCPQTCVASDSYGRCTSWSAEACEPFTGNCHARDLCPADTDGDRSTLEKPELYCFEPLGAATSTTACKNAARNACTIDGCE
jgi:hypothetical protein